MAIEKNGRMSLGNYQSEHIEAGGLKLNFQRTCRVPAGQLNSLPAGLGSFPVFRVKDFRSGCPKEWRDEGYFFPMYRQEAMWINFRGNYYPKAVIVGAGNINAVNGKPFNPSKDKIRLTEEERKKAADNLEIKLEKEQNYLVVPPQPWIDGWKAADGKVYQFVAAEMGSGETVEGQITGEEKIGGIQLVIYEAKKKLVPEKSLHEHIVAGSWHYGAKSIGDFEDCGELCCVELCCAADEPSFGPASVKAMAASPAETRAAKRAVRSMGFGRGGEIDQKIYPDLHGLEVWKDKPSAVEVFYMVSSEDFKQVTGYEAPPTPVTYEVYQHHGYPWFELNDQNLGDSKGSDIFEKLKPVG